MTTADPLIQSYLALSPLDYPLVFSIELRYEPREDAIGRGRLRIVFMSKDSRDESLVMRFEGVQQLRLIQPEWSEFSVSYLSITSIRERGMEGIGYRVHDDEEDTIDFLCDTFVASIEVRSSFTAQ